MGYRLYVRKINRIEYSDGAFNNMGDSVIPLLRDFPGDHWDPDDESRMEIDREDFKQGVEALERMPEKEFNGKYPGITREMSKDECVATLRTLLEESDPKNDVVALDWF